MATSTQPSKECEQSAGSNVVQFRRAFGTLPYSARGPFSYPTYAQHRIGEWDFDVVLVDSDACLIPGATIVAQFKDGPPFVTILHRTGRDKKGRFVTLGDPRETVTLDNGFEQTLGEHPDFIRIYGRVVDNPRIGGAS